MKAIQKYTQIAASLRSKHIFLKKKLGFSSQGTSMNPVLKEGDEILVERVSYEQLRFGNLITYERNGIFITHRFLYLNRQHKGTAMIITKADNRSKLDKPVPVSCLIGRVAEVKRNGQTIASETSFWHFVARLIAFLSLMEGQFFEITFVLKRTAFKHLKVNTTLKQCFINHVRKFKQWLLHFLLLVAKHQ